MPTYNEARAAITARAETVRASRFPDIRIFYGNGYPTDVDADRMGAYILCKIKYTSGHQSFVGELPGTRVRGVVVFTVACIEATGTAGVMEQMQSLANGFKYANLSGVQMQTPSPGSPEAFEGWFSHDLLIPFYYDQ